MQRASTKTQHNSLKYPILYEISKMLVYSLYFHKQKSNNSPFFSVDFFRAYVHLLYLVVSLDQVLYHANILT